MCLTKANSFKIFVLLACYTVNSFPQNVEELLLMHLIMPLKFTLERLLDKILIPSYNLTTFAKI